MKGHVLSYLPKSEYIIDSLLDMLLTSSRSQNVPSMLEVQVSLDF